MTYRGRNYQAWLLGGAAAVAMMHANAAAAQDTEFNIAPQPLASALNEFSVQSRQSVLFTTDLAQSKNSQGVSGQVEVADALSSILAGTGLSWRRQGGTFLVVRADADPQSGSAAGDGADGTVDTLVVTAQKREEDIQDVPIAISAFTQEDLTRQQIAGGPDLITQVPNMTFTKTNFSSYSVQLRGIGTQAISATTDPAVAVAFNNTPFIRNRFFEQEFYDLQRVEVLRGPQGTLYGRNATAGVVNIISAKPKFNFEARASADVSNFNSSRIEGMVNIPLVEDMVALRLAGAWTKRDGYATNELTGNPIDGRDLWSTRVSLRVTPSDRIDANLIWEHFEENDDRLRSGKQLCKSDEVTDVGGIAVEHDTLWMNTGNNGQRSGVQAQLSQGCARESLYSPDVFQTPNGSMLPYYLPLDAVGLPAALNDPYYQNVQSHDLRVIESAINPKYWAESDIGELQVSVDITDSLTLASETAYAADTVYSLQDFNRFNTAPGAWSNFANAIARGVLRTDMGDYPTFCDPQLGCSDRLIAVDISTAEATQFSQELRLSSDFDGKFNFSLGANFLRADSEDKYYVFINSLSLIAAINGGAEGFFDTTTPYVQGVTDNTDCLINGYAPGNPNSVYAVVGCAYMDPNPIESVNDQGHNYFLSRNPYKLISYAVFGEAYYQITDNLKLTGGLRWTVDKKEAPRIPTWVLANQTVGYPVAEVIEQEWREPTGRLTVDWKPDLSFTDETMIYGSYAHGYKAGGANPPGFVRVFYVDSLVATSASEASATRPKTFDPEFVDAFEVGTKNTLADGRVTLNLAAFYYDYKDYQISEIVDRSAFNRNFDATVWGVELEADWRPLENLRFGFKAGYQKTRIADGEEAIDLMDRTAGDPDWHILRPFPTYASSCILPTQMFARASTVDGQVYTVGNLGGGGPTGCELAYSMNLDPVTEQPYDSSTNITNQGFSVSDPYLGFNPETAPNGGEGIAKPLGGNELPNAPNWTLTGTIDYTIPLPNEWLATLHTDLHWQSESWWRVFNDHEFSRLDDYFTANIAAIFTNEEHGWNVMAYVKNVTDETAITGAFLNSDDTGLTTNVFLTEPRLYGLRVTKTWDGGPLLGSFGARREGPYPFTVELSGQIQRHDAPNAIIQPSFGDEFGGPLAVFDDAQNDDLDWGDGRSVKLTWQPSAGAWMLSASVWRGKTNGLSAPVGVLPTEPVCYIGPIDAPQCNPVDPHPILAGYVRFIKDNRADTRVFDREDDTVVEVSIGRDLAFGGLSQSTVSVGLRHARLESQTDAELKGVPDWTVEPEFLFKPVAGSRTLYDSLYKADREFEGVGPTVEWEASLPLLRFDGGVVNLDWSASAGVLFGQQEARIEGQERGRYSEYGALEIVLLDFVPTPTEVVLPAFTPVSRAKDVTVPTAGASLGLSYQVGGFKAGAGYRWERYFDAMDGGFTEHEDADRTMDGPYFKLSVGFGG